jgi:hypothetical protein
MSIFFGAIGAAIIVLYWVWCRRSALVHQARLGDLLVSYFDRDDVSESDKDAAYWTYSFSRTWFFMPAMAILSVFAFLYAIIADRLDSSLANIKRDDSRDEIMDVAIKMYMARNPISFILFMAGSLSIIGMMLPFGFIFRGLKSIPSPASVYSAIADRASHPDRRHAH